MTDHPSHKQRRDQSRKAHNEEFLRSLYARRPQAKRRYEPLVKKAESAPDTIEEVAFEGAMNRDTTGLRAATTWELVLETIVRKERPVLFVKDDWIDIDEVATIGEEAKELVTVLGAKRSVMQPLMPLIGRIDVVGFPGTDFLATGWFVETDIVVTNRHVASLIARWDGRKYAFNRGVAGKPITSSVNTLHEFDDIAVDEARNFAVTEVLYIEPDGGPDIAFLKVVRRRISGGTEPPPFSRSPAGGTGAHVAESAAPRTASVGLDK